MEACDTLPPSPKFTSFCVNVDDLTPIVHAASLAGTVGQMICAAVGALNYAGSLELPNGRTSLIASCF